MLSLLLLLVVGVMADDVIRRCIDVHTEVSERYMAARETLESMVCKTHNQCASERLRRMPFRHPTASPTGDARYWMRITDY